MITRRILILLVSASSLANCPLTRAAKPDEKPTSIELADGKVKLTAPKTWKQRNPRSRILQYEFAVPAVKGESTDGRVTIMTAGGSVEQNIDRWIAQFQIPSGKDEKEARKIEKRKIAGQTVHVVDLSGTYQDRARPFGPAVPRNDYRMLGAIIQTMDMGNHFIKFYGPQKTVGASREAFEQMLKSLQVR